MRISIRGAALLTWAMVTTFLPQAFSAALGDDEAVTLRWAPKVGEQFEWVIDVDVQTKGTLGGRRVGFGQEQHYELLMTPETQNAEGQLPLATEVRRVAVRIQQGGQDIRLDTEGLADNPNPVGYLARVKPILGESYHVMCSSRGEVLSVKGSSANKLLNCCWVFRPDSTTMFGCRMHRLSKESN